MYLWLVTNFYYNKCKESKKKYINNLIKKAIKLQDKKEYKEAKKIYLHIISLNSTIELFDYSVALNNLVVVLYYNNEKNDAKKYYNELVKIRENLLYLDIELYGIDYIYTKLMGIEWFNKSKQELNSLKELVSCYDDIYNTLYLKKKIKTLQ